MPDMLVDLLKLPLIEACLARLREQGITIRRANAYETTQVVSDFVLKHFSQGWADEVAVCFANKPISVFIATHEAKIIGFAAYECTRRNFFGPTGVLESSRNKGVGAALLLASLHAMHEMGYVYGIIGGVGPVDFYTKVAGATLIPNSTPGIYTDRLKG